MNTTESRQLVISLPKDGGKEMKKALKSIASAEHRTVSNKAFIILRQWLSENCDGYNDEPEEEPKGGTEHERVTYDDEPEEQF